MALDIERARHILGPEAESLSDNEIQIVLESLHALCSDLLDAQERGEL